MTNTINKTKVSVTEEQMKPYEVSIEELKSFDNDDMAPIKEMISKEINNLSIDFSIPGRIELELKYFNKMVSKVIEVIDDLNDAIKENLSSFDDEMGPFLLSLCSGVKNILESFGEYKEALEGGDPTKVDEAYKRAFSNALIGELNIVQSAPYVDVEGIEELMSSIIEQIKLCTNNEFDVDKTSNSYDQMLDLFDQMEQMISNDFDSFVDMIA